MIMSFRKPCHIPFRKLIPPFTLTDLKGLFTWSGGPRFSGVGFFCFHALWDTKQKKLTPLDRGPPLHVNRVLIKFILSGHPT